MLKSGQTYFKNLAMYVWPFSTLHEKVEYLLTVLFSKIILNLFEQISDSYQYQSMKSEIQNYLILIHKNYFS